MASNTNNAPLRWQNAPHTGYYINSVACSGDGGRVVGGTFFHDYTTQRRLGVAGDKGNFGTYCWDNAGNLLWSDTFDGYQGVYWVAMSADGGYAASCGWYSGPPNYAGFIAAFDAATGANALNYYQTPHRVNQVALSADGSTLVACSDRIYMFLRNGAQFSPTPMTHSLVPGDSAISVDVSADGQWVAAGTYEGSVILLKIVGGQPVSSQSWSPPSSSTVHRVAMAAGGRGFAVAMTGGAFAYFDCADFLSGGQPAWTQTLSGADSVYGIAIDADAKSISVVGNLGSGGGTVALYANDGSAATLAWQQTLGANPNGTSIDAQGLFVAVADGHPENTPGHFTLFNASSGVQIWSYTAGNMCWPIQIAADAMSCVAGSDDGNVYDFSPLRVLIEAEQAKR